MLWKGVVSVWIHEWLGKNIETWLPEKENVYSKLSIEDIAVKDYKNAKRVWKEFLIKNICSWFVCSKWYIIISLIYLKAFEVGLWNI